MSLLSGKLTNESTGESFDLDEVNLIGVPVSDDEAYHNQAIAALCGKTIAEFGLKVAMDDLRMRFLDGFVGEGYGIPYDDAIDGLRMLARTEGIMLDPVYTCKAFYGLLSEVKAGRLGQDRPVVFLHTGGIYSNFANSELLIQSAVKV